MGLVYLAGLIMFVTKWPECKYPGKFDIIVSRVGDNVLSIDDLKSTICLKLITRYIS